MVDLAPQPSRLIDVAAIHIAQNLDYFLHDLTRLPIELKELIFLQFLQYGNEKWVDGDDGWENLVSGISFLRWPPKTYMSTSILSKIAPICGASLTHLGT